MKQVMLEGYVTILMKRGNMAIGGNSPSSCSMVSQWHSSCLSHQLPHSPWHPPCFGLALPVQFGHAPLKLHIQLSNLSPQLLPVCSLLTCSFCVM